MFKFLLLFALVASLVASQELDEKCALHTNETGCKSDASCIWCPSLLNNAEQVRCKGNTSTCNSTSPGTVPTPGSDAVCLMHTNETACHSASCLWCPQNKEVKCKGNTSMCDTIVSPPLYPPPPPQEGMTMQDIACANNTNETACKADFSCQWCPLVEGTLAPRVRCKGNTSSCTTYVKPDCTTTVACFVSSCYNVICTSPSNLKCTPARCNCAERVWTDSNGTKVNCEKEERKEITPIENCENKCGDLEQPKKNCSSGEAKYLCVPTETLKIDSSSPCSWVGQCPTTSDTCGSDDCANTGLVTECRNNENSTTKCVPIVRTKDGVETKECTLVSYCPPPIVIDPPPVVCEMGGPCGDQCFEKNSSITVESLSVTACTQSKQTDCEQRCRTQFKTSCTYQGDDGCVMVFAPLYKECLARCSSNSTEPPQCSIYTDVCSCNFDDCIWAESRLTTVEGSTYIKRQCVLNSESASVKDSGSNLVYPRPLWCGLSPNNGTGNETRDRIDPIDIIKAQERLDTDLENVFKFLINILSVLESEVKENKEIIHRLIVTLTGTGSDSLSENDRDEMCNKLAKAVNSSTNQNCTVEKLVDSSSKRNLLQSGSSTYIVTTTASSSVPPSTPPATSTGTTPGTTTGTTPGTTTGTTPGTTTGTTTGTTPGTTTTKTTTGTNLGSSNGVYYQPSWVVLALVSLVLALATM